MNDEISKTAASNVHNIKKSSLYGTLTTPEDHSIQVVPMIENPKGKGTGKRDCGAMVPLFFGRFLNLFLPNTECKMANKTP